MRYFKVILSSLALFMVYMWIAVMLNACGNSSTTKKEDPYAEDVLVEGTEDEFESEFDGEESDEEYEEDGEALADEDEVDDSEPGDYTSAPSTTTTKSFPVEERKTTTNHSSSSVKSGRYLVIAGSYLIEENARKMMNKLKNKGFDAEIVHFNFSQYHSICAGRYSSQSTAKNTARTLKNMGIDAYVHTKQ